MARNDDKLIIRKMKTNKLNNAPKTFPPVNSGGRLMGLYILFFFLTQLSFAGTDTTKIANQQYALNDPRNPDCPCHKLQKQAEDEFAQQNNIKNQFDNVENSNKNNINEIEKNRSNSINEVGEKVIKTTSTTTFSKYKHKKKIVWVTKIKFKISKRIHRIKKTNPNYQVCFKW